MTAGISGADKMRLIARFIQLKIFVFIFRGIVHATTTTGSKRRGLNAPCPEAPRSACQTSTPSRAHLGELGRMFDGLGKFAVFRTARSRSYANWICCFLVFVFTVADD